ncbi:hypothetical protein ACW0JX_11685 [Bacillus sp. C-3-6]
MKIIELPIEFEFNGQKQCIYPSLIIVHNELTLVDTGYLSFLPLIGNPNFCLDIEKAKQSLNRIKSFKAAQYYCYHGGKLTV